MSYYEKVQERAEVLEKLAHDESSAGKYLNAAEFAVKARALREMLRDMPAAVAGMEVA